ncbi:SAM-dependent methyltransferase, partial [Burkholderia multivorans]
MQPHDADTLFAGSIPALYDTLLVPLLFEPYAIDLAKRAAIIAPTRVLELAAGTGA